MPFVGTVLGQPRKLALGGIRLWKVLGITSGGYL